LTGRVNATSAYGTIVRLLAAAAEISFEPSTEIHRSIVERHADIAKIASAVARWNVHAAAQCNC
jgi:hypothetical protein